MVDGETRAKLNGAMRDALKKGKIPFIEVNTAQEGTAIRVMVVTASENQEAVNRVFDEVAKRNKNLEILRVFKTPEALAKEKSKTLTTVLEILTGSEPYTLATIAERTGEPTWVIDKCLRDLSLKGVVQTVGEYDDHPTWTISKKNATYELAVDAARATGFDVGDPPAT